MNLDPFDQFADSELWQALEHAHLKEFVESLNEGIQYECGEGGQNLRYMKSHTVTCFNIIHLFTTIFKQVGEFVFVWA